MSETNNPDWRPGAGRHGQPGDDPTNTVAVQIDQLGDILDELDGNLRGRHPHRGSRTTPPAWHEVRQLNRVLLLLCEAGIELGIRHGRVRRGGAAEPADEDQAPACGHSACRQNWIESGSTDCVSDDEA